MEKNTKIRIGVLAKGLLGWGGGIDFLRYLCTFLDKLPNNQYEIVLLIPVHGKLFKLATYAKNAIKFILGKNTISPTDRHIEFENSIKACYSMKRIKYKLELLNSTNYNLKQVLKREKIDIIFPAIDPLNDIHNVKKMGYIFDFQHKHMPYLFAEKEIQQRDIAFAEMLSKCHGILVNSLSVKNDIEKYLTNDDKSYSIFSFPFLPIADLNILNLNTTNNVCEEYKIDKPFFIVSNQFWKHKDHATVFDALGLLKNDGYSRFLLICTGLMEDYRDPLYIDSLKKKIENLGISLQVRLLGHIPKKDQINLIRESIALIQPTLFEGGPGGGSTYDALAYGKRAIISDIEINKEIENENVCFFNAGNPQHLALMMKSVLQNKFEIERNSLDLVSIRERNIAEGVRFLDSTFRTVYTNA